MRFIFICGISIDDAWFFYSLVQVYPMNCRCAAAGISGAISYLIGFASNKSFLSLVASLTLHGTFWLYSSVSIGGCFVLYFILPETENKPLQEIETFFDKRKLKRFQAAQNLNGDAQKC